MKNKKKYLQAVKEIQSLDLKERLIPISNYPGYYLDSEYGINGYDVYSNKTNFKRLNGTFNKGYRQYGLRKDGKCKIFNRSVVVMMTLKGFVPNGLIEVVDHRDNDPTNDRIENLQVITHRENSSKDTKGVSKYPGVSYRSNKWEAHIVINGKQFYLGRYVNELDAAKSYLNYLKNFNKTLRNSK